MDNLEYTIVERDNPALLVRAVNGMIAKGWLPLGGVCVVSKAHSGIRNGYLYEVKTRYAQAMVRQVQQQGSPSRR